MASTVEVARKRRHLELLKRVQANQVLSAGELRELQEYESGGDSSAPAAEPVKPVRIVWRRRDRRKKRDRPPVPAHVIKSLGFECTSIPHAEGRVNCERSLIEVLAEWPILEVAWERGQMLRNLEQYAYGIMTVSQAAKLLGFERGQDLRHLLDTDVEVRSVWEQARLATLAASKQALVQSAKDGNHAAIKAVALLHREEGISPSATGPMRFDSISITHLADLLGVVRQTIHDWFTKHGLPRNADGSFDLATTLAWWRDYTVRKAAPGRSADSVTEQLERNRLAKRELELAREKSEVLPRVPVIQRYTLLMTTVVQELNRQVRDLGPLLVNKPLPTIVAQLEKFRSEMLQRLRNAPNEFELGADAQAAYESFFGVLFRLEAKDAGDGNESD